MRKQQQKWHTVTTNGVHQRRKKKRQKIYGHKHKLNYLLYKGKKI